MTDREHASWTHAPIEAQSEKSMARGTFVRCRLVLDAWSVYQLVQHLSLSNGVC